MHLDLSDEESLALAALLRRTIDEDRYPLSPRVLTWKTILAKLAPPPDVPAVPSPSAKPGDRPRDAVAARERQRRG
jgi:hypothetical protein